MSQYTPVIILGAPRSGTNMLRDVLTSFSEFGTWPCDEINYIWRHGNVAFSTDELPEDNASPAVIAYIRARFEDIARQQQTPFVVEKTCANCLRVPFVERVVPDAKYIYIYRDGIDAAGSAKLRWSSGLDIPYLLKKVRYVPFTDLPYYAIRYLWTRIYQFFSKENRLAFWGPKFTGLEDALRRYSLDAVCALQWQVCVRKAEEGLGRIHEGRICRVRYEDFVRQPVLEIERILNFIGAVIAAGDIQKAVAGVSSSSLGKGRTALGEEEVKRLEGLVHEELQLYDYL